MTIRVVSKAPFPIILANCESNRTLAAFNGSATAVHMSKRYFQWVVPEGATWDCESGCPECFYLTMGLEMGGDLIARIGYESHDGEDHGESDQRMAGGSHLNTTNSSSHGNETQQPKGAITGIEFAATEAVSRTIVTAVCKDDDCRPDWERDIAVAWGTTIDLIIHGTVDGGSKPSGMGQMMPLGFHAGGFHAGGWHAGGVHGGGWHAGGVHAGGWHGGGWHGHYHGYRPPVWRRPVWRHPYHPAHHCWACNYYCPWLCR